MRKGLGTSARGRPSGISKPPRMSSSSNAAFKAAAVVAAGSRRSSIIYGKGSQARADPRPIADKHFQIACMRRLVEYLTTHGYGFPIWPKLPSGKDIQNVIEFLFSQVDPTYRLCKLEEDVPAFFRQMGYPCQISKSALYAAGSPHSWPNLLVALVWLVDLLNYEEKENDVIKEQREGMAADHLSVSRFDDYINYSYDYFMKGDDQSCEALDEQCRQKAQEETEQAVSQAEECARQITELVSKLESLRSEPAPIPALEAKKSNLMSDIGKFNSLINNQTSHKANLEKKLDEQKQQLEAKEAEVARITQEIEALRERVGIQTVKVAEFERMTRELQRVEEELQSASTSRKEREGEIWEMEVLASKKLKELEMTIVECNGAIPRLKLSTLEAGTEAGNPFELRLNPRGETARDMLGVDIKGLIRPQLAAAIEVHEKRARETWKESTDILKQIHAMEDGLQEKQNANAELEAKIKKWEAMYKKEKVTLEEFVSSTAAECEALRTKMKVETEQLKTLELEMAEQQERANKNAEQVAANCHREVQQETSELLKIIEAVMGHKELIQSMNARLKIHVDQTEEMVNNNFIRKQKQ